MAHGFIRRSASNPICPICGYPGNDYCGRYPDKHGDEIVVCCRTEKCAATGLNYFNADGSCMGKDGRYYIRVGTSRGDNACFMDADTKLAADIRDGRTEKPANFKMPEYIPPVPKVIVDEVKPLANERLHKIYSLMAKYLKLEDWHRKYLHNEGWTDEMIEKYKVVSFPEKDLTRFKYRKNVKMKCPYRKQLAKQILSELGNPAEGLRGVPGAYQNEQGDWTFCGPSGIIFWQIDFDNNIYRARIRMDYRDVSTYIQQEPDGSEFFIENGEKWFLSMKGACKVLPDGTKEWKKDGKFEGKYRNLSSFFEDKKEMENNRIVNVYKNGCQSGNNLGFDCDPSRDDMYVCYITEGEKKGKFANYTLRAPIVELPGVSSWALLFNGKKGSRPVDKLVAKGIKYFIMAYDADKSVNADVLAKEQRTVEAIKEEGLFIGVAEWDINIGKGLDDLLAKGFKPAYFVC